MARALVPVLMILAAAVHALAADEAYTLKLYREKEGEAAKKTVTITTEGKKTVTVGDKTQDYSVKQVDHFVEVAEVVKWPAKAPYPTKLSRTFEKFDLTDHKGETTPTALSGKTMITETTGGKMIHTVDDKPLTVEQVTTYQIVKRGGDLSIACDWLPTKPVKVGDTWNLDVKNGLASYGKDFDAIDFKKSSFTGKLVKAARKDSALWGTVEFEERLAVTRFTEGGENLPAESGSEITFRTLIEACLDGTVPGGTVEVTNGLNATIKLPGDGKMTVAVTSKGKNTTEPVKKK